MLEIDYLYLSTRAPLRPFVTLTLLLPPLPQGLARLFGSEGAGGRWEEGRPAPLRRTVPRSIFTVTAWGEGRGTGKREDGV